MSTDIQADPPWEGKLRQMAAGYANIKSCAAELATLAAALAEIERLRTVEAAAQAVFAEIDASTVELGDMLTSKSVIQLHDAINEVFNQVGAPPRDGNG